MVASVYSLCLDFALVVGLGVGQTRALLVIGLREFHFVANAPDVALHRTPCYHHRRLGDGGGERGRWSEAPRSCVWWWSVAWPFLVVGCGAAMLTWRVHGGVVCPVSDFAAGVGGWSESTGKSRKRGIRLAFESPFRPRPADWDNCALEAVLGIQPLLSYWLSIGQPSGPERSPLEGVSCGATVQLE